MDWTLEVVVVPVSDVDRAKSFYAEKAGFDVDHDRSFSDTMRVVQLTPSGSGCSIMIGAGLPDGQPGTTQLQLVVSDIEAARAELVQRGVEVSEVQVMEGFAFAYFDDPDGNHWSVQQRSRIATGAAAVPDRD